MVAVGCEQCPLFDGVQSESAVCCNKLPTACIQEQSVANVFATVENPNPTSTGQAVFGPPWPVGPPPKKQNVGSKSGRLARVKFRHLFETKNLPFPCHSPPAL